jgi:hypothetical protein
MVIQLREGHFSLGVEVGSDGEMTLRQYFDNVPYSRSLRPEAKLEADSINPLLSHSNHGSCLDER